MWAGLEERYHRGISDGCFGAAPNIVKVPAPNIHGSSH